MAEPSAAVPWIVYFTVRWSAPVGSAVMISSRAGGTWSFDCSASNFQVPAQGSDLDASLSFCAKARAAMRIKVTKVSFFITNSSSCEYFLRSGDESQARSDLMMKLCVLIELDSPTWRFGCRATPGSCLTPAGRPAKPARQPVADDCRWIAERTWRLGFPPPKS